MTIEIPDICPYCRDPDCGCAGLGCAASREAEYQKTEIARQKKDIAQAGEVVRKCDWVYLGNGLYKSLCQRRDEQWCDYSFDLPFCQKCGGRIIIYQTWSSFPEGDTRRDEFRVLLEGS